MSLVFFTCSRLSAASTVVKRYLLDMGFPLPEPARGTDGRIVLSLQYALSPSGGLPDVDDSMIMALSETPQLVGGGSRRSCACHSGRRRMTESGASSGFLKLLSLFAGLLCCRSHSPSLCKSGGTSELSFVGGWARPPPGEEPPSPICPDRMSEAGHAVAAHCWLADTPPGPRLAMTPPGGAKALPLYPLGQGRVRRDLMSPARCGFHARHAKHEPDANRVLLGLGPFSYSRVEEDSHAERLHDCLIRPRPLVGISCSLDQAELATCAATWDRVSGKLHVGSEHDWQPARCAAVYSHHRVGTIASGKGIRPMAQRPGRADAEDSPSAPGATPVDPDLEIGPGEDVPSFAGFYSAEIARGRSRPPLKRLRRKQPDRLPVGADTEGAEGSPLRRSEAESSRPVYTSAEQAGSPLGDLVAVAEGITTRAGSPHGGPRGGVAALPELAVSPLGSARSQAAAVQADSPLGIDVGQFAKTEPAGSPRGRADEDVDMLAGQAGAPLSKSRPARERALGGSGDKGFPSLAGSPARVPKPAVLVKGAA